MTAEAARAITNLVLAQTAVVELAMKTIQQEIGDVGKGEQFKCTACGISVHITQVVPHPLLLVGVCTVYYNFLFSNPFTKDNPDEEIEVEGGACSL